MPPERSDGPDDSASRTRSRSPREIAAVWQVDLAPVAVTIGDQPSARPALVLVVADGQVLHVNMITHPPTDAAAVAELLAAGIAAACSASGVRPGAVAVRDRSVASALRPRLEGVSVRTARELGELDAALASFDEVVVGRAPELGRRPRIGHPDTWAGWGLPKEQIARFFSAGAAYYRAAPWKHVMNDDVFRLKVKGGGSWSASVMGNAGELYGLAMYARLDDLVQILEGSSPQEATAAMRGAVISFSFGPKGELSPRAQKEVIWSRWEVAGPRAYPVLFTMNTLGGGTTARQMDDFIAALESLPRFAAEYEEPLRALPDAAFEIRWRDAKAGLTVRFERGVY